MVFQARYGKYLDEFSSVSQSYEIHLCPLWVVCCVGSFKMRKSHLYRPGLKLYSFARSIRILYMLFESGLPSLSSFGCNITCRWRKMRQRIKSGACWRISRRQFFTLLAEEIWWLVYMRGCCLESLVACEAEYSKSPSATDLELSRRPDVLVWSRICV